MGCGSSKSDTQRAVRYSEGNVPAAPRSSLATNKPPTIGMGQPLGGGKKEIDVRQAQLEAAEKRAAAYANRGLAGTQKGQELSDAAKKQELIGKINAAYQTLNKDPPMGLSLASLDQLRNHYEQVTKNKGIVNIDNLP